MLVLALDTATPAITAGVVALADSGPRLLAERVTLDPRAAGELLTPQVHQVAEAAGIALAELAAIVTGAGPGPFTSLRAGMVTAAAFGQALDKPVHPVSTLDAIAAGASHEAGLLVVTDARRREVYWSAYDAAGRNVTGPRVDRPDAVAELLTGELAGLGITQVAGHVAAQHAELFGLAVLAAEYPTPVGLVRAAESALSGEPAPLTPLYLRRPDAVEPAGRKRVSPA
ncbi:tRNA (adenosine(37)-N6)-threonylcarbamoyltransferase complex dimerization subunit type 1 TsaB [Crossiella sp. CA-258035]|uniref:tRNA (adenosine(37)-N6)-threonylcarbamoyltransferase complex dimerization subunit type 1 TsaB n=1 Tax=Crossiella sp. CA-258035 TaxID=2981138 RepID=UPI0024BD1A31|nr:tRNA (adenosine(37)-N6)-threonylcarbamoyltransferase complex dimerization subunit type 1 TsaB [Crossiella sp. CA-258035]WHT18852.1 tRNA (adenosine(37)-N6)-threonylcarbamoyltransferase complex dimerization subunit type 1 TsaB [Crossiella sp. CA-258035]